MLVDRRKHELERAASGSECTIDFEGKRLSAKEGEPLMVTLLAHGIETASRSVKYHRPRGAYCLAGICGQCWMRIDDLPNRAACITPIRPALAAARENAFPSADLDWFRAADLVFAEGLDHHRLATTPIGPLNAIMQDTARRLAGLGTLSTTAPKPAPPFRKRRVDLSVIGAGPAGLAAARAAAGAGLSTVVIESRDQAGGRLRTGLYGDVESLAALPASAVRALEATNGEIWLSSIASGIYRDAGADLELLVRRNVGQQGEHLVLVEAKTLIFANGGYEQTPLFESNDLPGHYGARALAELVNRHGVLPGKRVVIGGSDVETAERLQRALLAIGASPIRVSGRIAAARGSARVKGVDVVEGSATTHVRCDVIASALPVAPAFELARQAGCAIEHRPNAGGFAVVTEPESGRTTIDRLFAAGEVTGAKTAEQAAIEGEIAGRSAVRALG